MLPVVLDLPLSIDTKLYLAPQLESNRAAVSVHEKRFISEPLNANGARLFYHINKYTCMHYLYIPPSVA